MNLGRETETLEFKKSTSELKSAMDDIAAILNKHQSGTLYFGIKPNGDVCGQEIGNLTLDDIARYCKEAIKPMIYPTIEVVMLDNKQCIKVDFSGYESPYSSYGIYYKRVNDRSEIMSTEELKIMMISRDYTSTWENALTRYGLESIDHNALRAYYQEAISCGRLEPLLEYSEKELLTGLGLYENEHLTNAGFFLFSSKKPVVLKIATYLTDQRINFSDIRRIEDNIYNLIRYANTYIKEKINWRVEMGNGVSRIEVPEIPIEAIREIVVNSFAHANYIGMSENEIDITPTQVEIYNPGPFPTNLSPEMFVSNRKKSFPRNRIILNTLYKCKDVEIFGSGFKKVFESCKNSNVSFTYKSDEEGFSFIFFRKNEESISSNIVDSSNNKLPVNCLSILGVLKGDPTLTQDDIATTAKLSKRTVQRCLEMLVNEGYIKRVGSKKIGYWKILR